MFKPVCLPYRRPLLPTTNRRDIAASALHAGMCSDVPISAPQEGIVRNAQLSFTGRAVRWVTAAVAAALAVAVVSVPVAGAQQRDIVDTAVAAGQFNTLARAVQAAGLVDTLKGPGPFTVFAPTDAAFNKLPAGTLDQLLANPQQLRAVLTYHVVPGRVTAAQVTQLQSATTVQGEAVRISASALRPAG